MVYNREHTDRETGITVSFKVHSKNYKVGRSSIFSLMLLVSKKKGSNFAGFC